MKRIRHTFRALLHDEHGGEVIEYALIAGLIVAACVAIVGQFGSKVFARWSSVNSSL